MLVLFLLCFLFCSVFLHYFGLFVIQFLYRYGTTHKVNNFLIQNRGHFGSSTEIRSPNNKKASLSFNAEYETCYNVTHFSSKCIGPVPKEVDFDQFRNPAVFMECNMNDFLWVFLSWRSVPKQIIPSWTGFSIIIHDKMVLLKSSIRYLHCIYVPTTEIATIYQVC